MVDTELGAFIRSRREAVSPTEVGLPEGARRRTPGLRRSELATLAGISVDYLIRLEQGRDRRPSAQVLAAIATALRLGESDRMHLNLMSAVSSGEELCPTVLPSARVVRPTVRAILDHLEPAPAMVLNHLTDILAWTSGYEAIGAPVGILEASQPNLVRYTFCDPRARITYPSWDRVADEQVANLRSVPRFGQSDVAELAAELAASAGGDFSARWDARPVDRKGSGLKELRHPDEGVLRLAFETMQLPDPDDQRLVVYLPADPRTSEALDRIAGRRPGGLRAVAPDRVASAR